MHPVLLHFQVGGTELVLGAYSTFYVLAWVLALALATVIAWRRGSPWRRTLLLCAGALVAGIVGARLLDLATNWGVYAADPGQIYGFDFHGFSLYGGLILALWAGALLSWALHLPLWKLADSAVPAMVAGIVLMRIGCFLNGCCFGTVTSLPWGVTFPAGSPAWSWQLAAGQSGLLGFTGLVLPVHPTQVYEIIAALVFGGVAAWLTFRRPSSTAAGVPFLAFALGFTLFRVAEYYLRPRPFSATEPTWLYPLLYAVIIAGVAATLIYRATRRPVSTR
jgi:phosphatidylglycerol:prolipoprotein diacylglycerol transferase